MSQEITLHLNRDDEFSIQFSNPDGSPFNLTGCQVFVALKLTPGGDELLRLSPGAGVDITLPVTQGFVRFTVSRAAKAAAGLTDLVTYFWDALLVDDVGRCLPLDELAGDAVIVAAITNPPA